jgi:hypothetical protein
LTRAVISALCLVFIAAEASANCAWVEWVEIFDPARGSRYEARTAHETKAECEIALTNHERALLDGGNFERDSQGRGFRHKHTAQSLLFRSNCLPSNIDPRGRN